jgi:hypothetical protein
MLGPEEMIYPALKGYDFVPQSKHYPLSLSFLRYRRGALLSALSAVFYIMPLERVGAKISALASDPAADGLDG